MYNNKQNCTKGLGQVIKMLGTKVPSIIQDTLLHHFVIQILGMNLIMHKWHSMKGCKTCRLVVCITFHCKYLDLEK